MKTTTKFITFLLAIGLPLFGMTQERQIKLSVQTGWFKANNQYKNMKTGWNCGGDASYFISKRFFIAAHFNYGTGRYYEDRYTKFPDDAGFPRGVLNADLININIGLMAGYQLPITKWLNVSAQFGIAQYVEVTDFLIRVVRPDVLDGWTHQNAHRAWVSASFPVKFTVGFMPLKFLEIGIAGGFYLGPDYSPAIVGLYLGPQLSVIF